jgi:nucleoside-diphosphate-sugar epimerase
MEKISTFGSTGFIGSMFCSMFSNDVVKIDREDYVPKTKNILSFISTTDNYNIFTEPLKDIETNLIILVKILQNCKEGDTFNLISSWSAYGKIRLPAQEDDYCDPTGFYPITKRTGEQLLISYCKTFNINYRIFRLCNVIGETDMGVGKKKNALQYLIGEIKEGKDINLYRGGQFLRDYMHVEDISEAIHLCIERSPLNDIYNIGSGNPYVFLDLLMYCKDKLHSNSQFITVEPSPFHTLVQAKDMYLNVDKLASLNFKQKYNIWEALDRIMKCLK